MIVDNYSNKLWFIYISVTTYKINVKTSDIRGAGTDANVYVTLFGAYGDSGELHLKDSETNSDPFENNQNDVFTFKDMLSLGPLTKVRVWHDNKGENPDSWAKCWQLERILALLHLTFKFLFLE